MTIDEAIKQLTTYSIPCGKYKNAYDMAIETMRKYQKIEKILNTNVVYRDSDFMMLSAIKRVVDGDKQEDIFWKFIDEVENGNVD